MADRVGGGVPRPGIVTWSLASVVVAMAVVSSSPVVGTGRGAGGGLVLVAG